MEITEETAELVARLAGLDIGKAELVCCLRVPDEDRPGRRRQEVRTFATVTRSLLELRDWLTCEGVTLCVMKATSTYWKPPFYLLEDAIECWVVNAGDVKNVPGPAEDGPVGCGLAGQAGRAGNLRPSFIPPPWQRELRDLCRYRRTLATQMCLQFWGRRGRSLSSHDMNGMILDEAEGGHAESPGRISGEQ